MPEVRVNFNDTDSTYYLGRNGEGKAIGIELSTYPRQDNRLQLVNIMPINGEGDVARCTITFPANQLDDVIQALQRLKTETPTTTALRQV